MNKILPYVVIAILLGTVTMAVPLALLGPSDYTSLTEEGTLIQPSPTEQEQPSAPTETPTETEQLDNQGRAYTEGGTLDSVPSEPLEPETEEPPVAEPTPEPEAVETDLIIESLSNLSPIGLMTIPSFLIALGAFIYLKKRRS